MGIIKFILVLLLCVPVAYFAWSILSGLTENIRKQQQISDAIRMRKAAFQKPEQRLYYDEKTGYMEVNKVSRTKKRVNTRSSDRKKRSQSSAKRREREE